MGREGGNTLILRILVQHKGTYAECPEAQRVLSVQGSLAKGSEDEQAGREEVTEFIVTSGGRQGCGRHLCKVGGVKEQAPWTTASQRHRKWAQNTHGGGGGIWQPWDAHCNRAGSSVYFFKTKLKITTQNI